MQIFDRVIDIVEEDLTDAGAALGTLGAEVDEPTILGAAAGEAVAKAENSTWDKLIADRIFKPLGMKNSDTAVAAMQKSRDYSLGYDYNPSTKVTRLLPQRELAAVAPAGATFQKVR